MTEKEKEILRSYIDDKNEDLNRRSICLLALTTSGMTDLLAKHTDILEDHNGAFEIILDKFKDVNEVNARLSTKLFWLEVVVSIMMIATVVFAITHI